MAKLRPILFQLKQYSSSVTMSYFFLLKKLIHIFRVGHKILKISHLLLTLLSKDQNQVVDFFFQILWPSLKVVFWIECEILNSIFQLKASFLEARRPLPYLRCPKSKQLPSWRPLSNKELVFRETNSSLHRPPQISWMQNQGTLRPNLNNPTLAKCLLLKNL